MRRSRLLRSAALAVVCLASACARGEASRPSEAPVTNAVDQGPSDSEIVARITKFAGEFAAAIGANASDCAAMGEALARILSANEDLLALRSKLIEEDPERKERIGAKVSARTDELIASKMTSLRACSDDPKVRAVLRKMPLNPLTRSNDEGV